MGGREKKPKFIRTKTQVGGTRGKGVWALKDSRRKSQELVLGAVEL